MLGTCFWVPPALVSPEALGVPHRAGEQLAVLGCCRHWGAGWQPQGGGHSPVEAGLVALVVAGLGLC